jgi:hypothetical protein
VGASEGASRPSALRSLFSIQQQVAEGSAASPQPLGLGGNIYDVKGLRRRKGGEGVYEG